MFQLLSRSSKKNWGYDANKRPQILFLSKEQYLFNLLKEHLAALSLDFSLFISSDLSNLEPIDQSLSRCEVIVVDGSLGRFALDTARRALHVIPDYSIVVGVYTDEASRRVFYDWHGLYHLSAVLDIGNGWGKPWKAIMEIRNAWHRPIMVSHIDDISVSDVLQMIADGQWSSQVNMRGTAIFNRKGNIYVKEGVRGCITFNQGRPTNAWSSESVGVQAIHDLLSLISGELFVVRPPNMTTNRNVNNSIQEIIFRYTIEQDELATEDNEEPDESFSVDSFKVDPGKKDEEEKEDMNVPGNVIFPAKTNDNSANTDPWEKTEAENEAITDSKDDAAHIEYHNDIVYKYHGEIDQIENEVGGDGEDVSQPSKSDEVFVDISIISIAQQAKLDDWWSNLSENLVDEIFASSPKGSFPLRWMNPQELRLLSQDRNRFHCIVVKGDETFVTTVLSGYGRNFDHNRLLNDEIPIIRIGRYDGSGLYLVCLTHERETDFLSHHPCVVWLDTDDSEDTLKRARHPVSIVFSTDTKRVNRIIKDITLGATDVYAVVETQKPTWENISAGFGKIIELLSRISIGGH